MSIYNEKLDWSNIALTSEPKFTPEVEKFNPIRLKVEQKFGMKVSVGPSDYVHQISWNLTDRNEHGMETCIYSIHPDGKYHLGLIDFETDGFNLAVATMRHLFGEQNNIKESEIPWLLFSSGRSFHGYAKMSLLPEVGWRKFMGRLLVLNEKNQPKVVDDRWVGWCLIKGWAALRITKNDPHYLKVPELVAESD